MTQIMIIIITICFSILELCGCGDGICCRKYQIPGYFFPFVALRLIFYGVLSYFSLLYRNVPAQMSMSAAVLLPPSLAPADWLFGGCAAALCVWEAAL